MEKLLTIIFQEDLPGTIVVMNLRLTRYMRGQLESLRIEVLCDDYHIVHYTDEREPSQLIEPFCLLTAGSWYDHPTGGGFISNPDIPYANYWGHVGSRIDLSILSLGL